MPEHITTSCHMLVEAAEREIKTIRVDEARALRGDEAVFVDIRKLNREGRMPGALSCRRDMLEFCIDRESQYHKPAFAEGKKFIIFRAGACGRCLQGRRHTAAACGPSLIAAAGSTRGERRAAPSKRRLQARPRRREPYRSNSR
jgi:hypothetical protein